MTKRELIMQVLSSMQPADAIKLVESIGKQIRRENSIRINTLVENIRIMTKR